VDDEPDIAISLVLL
jgi:two-component system, OmpR family, response regulator ChvI